ncbi:MAG TPA: SUMF1/EgtB/PvdO family nonheme iron enzyme [Candidatus Stackebrandtia excrementipullorum]|nr:SUMF1/EgtB/PvdO family nonheme iron enzyme [Candidatus Stackebrandtia excrementipullorum]
MAVVTVDSWTGREAALLRQALRMSLREFARHLGVAERTVSYWERSGDTIVPRYESQAILDACLATAGGDAQRRFKGRLSGLDRVPLDDVATVWHPVDGKAMVKVGAGDYLCGTDNRVQWMDEFYVDVTPVTNAEYMDFVSATGHHVPRHWIDECVPAGLENHPVVYVTYSDAVAYATWAQKQLPTCYQWEKSARGESGNAYPWGDQPTAAKCNVRQSRIGSTTPVYRYHSGTSEYGVYDLAGNVWEWCSTDTGNGRYVLKGSAFTSPFAQAAGAAVNDAAPTTCDDDIGFRTVADSL